MESNGLSKSDGSGWDNSSGSEAWSGTTTLGEGGPTAHDAHQLLESVLPPKCLWRRGTSNTAPPNTVGSVKMRAGATVKLEACGPNLSQPRQRRIRSSVEFFAQSLLTATGPQHSRDPPLGSSCTGGRGGGGVAVAAVTQRSHAS